MFHFLLTRWKTGLLLAIFAVSLFSAWKWQNYRTDGFTASEVYFNNTYDSRWESDSLTKSEEQDLKHILSQRFSYIAKGAQSYVLRSEDGRYVIKFFKGKHLAVEPWMRAIANIPIFSVPLLAKIHRREMRKESLFAGCSVAYKRLRQRTALVYLHLNPLQVPGSSTLHIVDRIGREQEVELTSAAFFIQRYAVPILCQFQIWRDAGEHQKAKAGVAELFTYLVQRSQAGVLDTDTNYANNLGFLDGQVINLDVGALVEDNLIKNPVEYRRRLMLSMNQIRNWLQNNYPVVADDYEKQMATIFQ